jgi:oligopeptide transport system permease protein
MSMNEKYLTDDMFKPAAVDSTNSEEISRPSISLWKDARIRLFRNKGAVASLFVILFIIIMAFVGPIMNDYGEEEQHIYATNLPPKVPVLEKISWLGFNGVDIRGLDQYEAKKVEEGTYYWFGTDYLGRDLWTRVWSGTQVSLYIAFLAAFLDLVIGVAYGGISAYYGGRVDDIMQRIVEVLTGIPNLVVIILMLMIMDAGVLSMTVALVMTGWIGMSRMVRGIVLKLKNQEFVLASKTLGASDRRLIQKHLVPNTIGMIIITTMFTIPGAIFFEAFLSYIGLGIAPPQASLGSLISDGFKLLQVYPHAGILPSVVLSLLMISFNILGDGLRDAFDPRMRK